MLRTQEPEVILRSLIPLRSGSPTDDRFETWIKLQVRYKQTLTFALLFIGDPFFQGLIS